MYSKNLLLLFLGLCLFSCKQEAEETPKGPPNILFIFSDDHALNAISAYSGIINQTPNLDRLASEGMLFENAFCTNSICAPSRAVILTGQHSHLNGILDNRLRFDSSKVTFPKIFQQGGYETAMIGKWHLKSAPTGFDFWKVLPGQGHYYNPDFRSMDHDSLERIEGYVTDIVTDISLDWLKNGRDPNKPFMLMSQHKAPHREWSPGPNHLNLYDGQDIPEPPTLFDDYGNRASPAANQEMEIDRHMDMFYDLRVKQKEDESSSWMKNAGIHNYNRMTPDQQAAWDAAFEDENADFMEQNLSGDALISWKYQRYIKNYLRCIASLDDNIGRILDYLDESGLAENTIVVYSSDQGFYLGEHGWYDKRWMYEESLHMPLIVRWPGVVNPGQKNTDLIQNLDYAETFLDIAGLEIPASMQGQSFLPILKGEKPENWRSSIYYHYHEFPAVHMVAKHYGIRTDRYKLISYYETDEWELFDLQNDPREMNSVYDDPANEGLIQDLKQQLAELKREAQDDTAP